MPKATILVQTTPGGGVAVVDAVRDDPRVRRGFAALGAPEAVLHVEAATQDDLLAVIRAVNAVPEQSASETMVEMELQVRHDRDADLDHEAELLLGRYQALLLVQESKDEACQVAHTLFGTLMEIPGVVEAYPLLGRIDDAVWVRFSDLEGLSRIVAAVQETVGVQRVEALVEAVRA